MSQGIEHHGRRGVASTIAALTAAAGTVAVCAVVAGVNQPVGTSGVQPSDAVAVRGAGATPVMACYADDGVASPEQVAAVQAIIGESLLRYNEDTSWTSQGRAVELSWSLVPDGTFIDNGIGEGNQTSTLFATMDAKFGGNRALWISLIDQSFERWSEVSGNTYVRVTSGGNDWDDGANWGANGNGTTRGDIRIGMKNLFNQAGGVLAYNALPDDGDMVLDSNENWQSSGQNYIFLRNVVMHEHGHGLGFRHICPIRQDSLMEPTYTPAFDGPQHDDIRAVHRGYGDLFEPNDTISFASDLGVLPPGSTNISGLPAPAVSFGSGTSLDDNTDRDFYRIELSSDAVLDIIASPVGRTYDDSDQLANGNCLSGNFIDSRAIHDIRLRLFDSAGVLLIDQNATGLGAVESIVDEPLTAGEYFVRVSATNSTNESQLYNLAFDVEAAPDCVNDSDCDDGDPSNGVEVCDAGECVTLPFPDCNMNGLDDGWEIANNATPDCNNNGIPDSCDLLDVTYAASSGNLSPIGQGFSPSFTFTGTPVANAGVTLDFSGLGDFSDGSAGLENVEVFVGGVSIGTIFNGSTTDCTAITDGLSISSTDWNNARDANGDVEVQFVANVAVNAGLCQPADSRVEVAVSYTASAVDTDTNNNGIPDSCENSQGCSPADITTTGSSNGEPDQVVDLSDFSFYLTLWSTSDPAADLTTTGSSNGVPDSVVDLSDFSFYLTLWSAGCP